MDNIKTEKYLEKRGQIMKIIESTSVKYQDRDEDGNLYDKIINVNCWDVRDMAEKILSKFGLSKPEELTKEETKGYMISFKGGDK